MCIKCIVHSGLALMMSSRGVSQCIIDLWQEKRWQPWRPLITGSKSPEHTLCGVRNGRHFLHSHSWNHCKTMLSSGRTPRFPRVDSADKRPHAIEGNSVHMFIYRWRSLIHQLELPAIRLTTLFTPSSTVLFMAHL